MRARTLLRTLIPTLFAVLVVLAPFHGDVLRTQPIGAFGAFYCGGVAVRADADPYLVEPLRSCEQKLPGYANYGIQGVVEPVPLPGYALAPFSVLSLLPFPLAFLVFSLFSVLATVGAVAALARLTGLTPLLIGSALLLGDLAHNLIFGELPPLVIGALAFAGLLLSRKRFGIAAAALGVALVEPHIVLPAVIAVGVAMPAMRRPLAVLGAVLVGFTCVATGLHGVIEYVARVLPMQAAAELPAIDQYGLAWLLNLLGVGDGLALTLGSLSYILSAIAGTALAVFLARRFEEPAFLVFFPPAIAMVGGGFLHDIQMPIAGPAALLLFARSRFMRAWSAAALTLLAVPWSALDRNVEFAVPFIVGVIIWECAGFQTHVRRAAIALAGSLAAFAFFHGLERLSDRPFHAVGVRPASIAPAGDSGENASANWFRYVRASGYGTSSPQSCAEKIPFWGALLMLGFAGLGSLRRLPGGESVAGDPEAFPT